MNDHIEPTISRVLRAVVVWAVYIVALSVPIFYLPITADPLFAKHLLVMLCAATAFSAWLVRMLLIRRSSYIFGLGVIVALVFLGSLLISSIFSIQRAASFFAADPTGERFLSIVSFFIFSFLIASEFSKKEIVRMVILLLGSGAVLGIHTFFRVLPFLSLPDVVVAVNPVGAALNTAGALLGSLFLLALITLLFLDRKRGGQNELRFLRSAALVTTLVSGISLLLVNFKIGWITMAATTAVLIAFHFSRQLPRIRSGGDQQHPPQSSSFKISVVLFACLAVFALFSVASFHPLQFIPGIRTEVEVAPSFGATLAIAQSEMGERPIVGSGPGTFVYDYLRFKSKEINQTLFWNARFVHGFSLLGTLAATTGGLGITSFLLFFGAIIFILYRVTGSQFATHPLTLGLGACIVFIMMLWTVYPSNFTVNAMWFLALGAFLGLCLPRGTDATVREKPFWRYAVFHGTLHIERQGIAFITALLGILLFVSSALAAYFGVGRYVAEVYFTKAVTAFSVRGNPEEALANLDRALTLNPQSDKFFITKAQMHYAFMQQAISRLGAGGTGTEAEFRFQMNAAIEAAQRATVLNPYDSENWLVLGTIYEAVLPVVAGAESLAVKAYEEAMNREPGNPIPPATLGGMHLTLLDLLRIRAERGLISKKEAADTSRMALDRAKEYLEKATMLKSDYARAQFLFAQAYTREGNAAEAIRRGTTAALIAPEDVGIAFYLGLLFYQNEAFADAEEQFSRAIVINPNYSNARYFLGLIYDRTGRPGEALKQFRQIAALNPDNQEMQVIIRNLESGLPALAGSVPPPPAERKEPPVKEDTSRVRRKQ